MSTLGIDLDGVLADFVKPYNALLAQVAGVDRIPQIAGSYVDPPCWNYETTFGYTPAEVSAAWKVIKKSPTFWLSLGVIPGIEVDKLGERIDRIRTEGHNIYFITSRPGVHAKAQSEEWLSGLFGVTCPTVICHSDKAAFVDLLDIDAYIDDRLETQNDVMRVVRANEMLTRVYLVNRPYNDRPPAPEDFGALDFDTYRDPGLHVVESLSEALDQEGL